jgi:hypothetical protein
MPAGGGLATRGVERGAKSPSPVYRAAKAPIRARLVRSDCRRTSGIPDRLDDQANRIPGPAALLFRTGTDRLTRQASPIRRLSLPAPQSEGSRRNNRRTYTPYPASIPVRVRRSTIPCASVRPSTTISCFYCLFVCCLLFVLLSAAQCFRSREPVTPESGDKNRATPLAVF